MKIDPKKCTLDHVVPKSQGGEKTWENSVTACPDCNGKKKNNTPRQAGMKLLIKPFQPTVYEFFMMKIRADGIEDLLNELLNQ